MEQDRQWSRTANGAGRNGAGADGAANLPCVPCLGTGRMTLGEVS